MLSKLLEGDSELGLNEEKTSDDSSEEISLDGTADDEDSSLE